MRRARVAVAAFTAVLLACAPVFSADAHRTPAQLAAGYLAGRQLASGAFGTPDQPADATAETLASALAAGVSREVSERALRYVRVHGPERARTRAGVAGRLVLGLLTAGVDPRTFGGFDYLAAIDARYDAVTGKYDDGLYADALAALAVVAMRGELPDRAVAYLRINRCPDGGFAHDSCAQASDVDTTAMVLMVLLRGAPRDEATTKARLYLAEARNADLGWGQRARDDATNANSTALAISALSAAGEEPSLAALLALQRHDGGVRFSAVASDANDYATVQAIPALLRQSYPLRPAPILRSPAPQPRTVPVPRAQERSPISAPTPAHTACAPGDGAHHANLVIVYGDNTTERYCVAFLEAHISGVDLLERSGAAVVYQDAGGGSVFVCAIGGQGRDYPRESCIPPCPRTGTCAFWGYYSLAHGRWSFSSVGAGARMLADGDTDGWRYGMHDATGGGCTPDVRVQPACSAPVRYVQAPSSLGRHRRSGLTGLGVLALVLTSLAHVAARFELSRREVNA